MKKSQLLGTVCAAALVVLSNTAHAALVSQLLGLDIDGTLYDVTFHTDPGDSFMALWDADNDGVFGGGSSVFDTAPTFWGDLAGATSAAAAIVEVLGNLDTTTTSKDSFFIPHAVQLAGSFTTALTAGIDNIRGTLDWDTPPDSDTNTGVGQLPEDNGTTVPGNWPYASFEVSAVPVPAAVWLFGSGLLGLIGVARRKKA